MLVLAPRAVPRRSRCAGRVAGWLVRGGEQWAKPTALREQWAKPTAVVRVVGEAHYSASYARRAPTSGGWVVGAQATQMSLCDLFHSLSGTAPNEWAAAYVDRRGLSSVAGRP